MSLSSAAWTMVSFGAQVMPVMTGLGGAGAVTASISGSNSTFVRPSWYRANTSGGAAPAQPRGRPGREASTAPGGHQRQAVHRERLAVAGRPLRVGHADWPQHSFAQLRADVLLRGAAQGGGDGVGQHADAGVAVLQLCP